MFQSGFRKKVVNDIRTNNKLTVLVLHDLSASFDTLDHQILLNRVGEWFGPSAVVLKWFHSYLCGRELFFVFVFCFISTDNSTSKHDEITCGVPQGFILGPLLFNLYMLPLGNVIRRHGISFHS